MLAHVRAVNKRVQAEKAGRPATAEMDDPVMNGNTPTGKGKK